MLGDNARLGDQERMKLSEVDDELIILVAFGRTDDEIATQLRIPKDKVLDHIAGLLAKLGTRERLELFCTRIATLRCRSGSPPTLPIGLRNKTVAVGDAQGPFTLAHMLACHALWSLDLCPSRSLCCRDLPASRG